MAAHVPTAILDSVEKPNLSTFLIKILKSTILMQLKNLKFYVLSSKPKYSDNILNKTKNRLASHYYSKRLCKLENPAEARGFRVLVPYLRNGYTGNLNRYPALKL